MKKQNEHYPFKFILIGLLIIIVATLLIIEWKLIDIKYKEWEYYIRYIPQDDINTTITVHKRLSAWGNLGCVIDNARIATEGDSRGYEFIFRCPIN